MFASGDANCATKRHPRITREETVQASKANDWQKFAKGMQRKGATMRKESIFKSPDTVEGKNSTCRKVLYLFALSQLQAELG